MRCDDPKCGCQPYPRKNRKVEIVLYGDQPDQFCPLNQQGSSIDVIFDPIGNAMILREIINDPTRKYTFWNFSVQLDAANLHFMNLEGLADGSLILTVRIRSSACAVRGSMISVKEKISGFAPPRLKSKLYNDLYLCDWPRQTLQLFLPEERLVEWKTVALILKSFGRITADQWSDMVWMKDRPSVAGLNWRAIARDVKIYKNRLAELKAKGKQKYAIGKENDITLLQQDSAIA
ncbi:amylase [Aspergillus flavus]|nr:amylase [Aspergillus flavus]RAQ76111.1 amylase [Aspergillus flavus]